MYRLALLLIASFLVQGCTWKDWTGDFATPRYKFDPPAFDLVSLGDSKESVISALGQPDVRESSSLNDKGEQIEVWQYWQYTPTAGPDQVSQRHAVIFTNGKLSGWRAANSVLIEEIR